MKNFRSSPISRTPTLGRRGSSRFVMAQYHKIPSVPNKNKLTPVEAWPLIKNKICSELFRNELNTIPSLIDASHYDFFTVAIKQPKGNVLGRRPVYQVLGHLADLVNLGRTDVDRLLDSSKPLYEQANYPKEFKFQGFLDKGGDTYDIRVDLHNIEKFVLNISMEKGDLYLKTSIPQLREAKSVYLVTDIIYVKQIVAQTNCSLYKEQLNIEGPTPVAFGFTKFAVNENGLVSNAMKCKVHSDAVWEDLTDEMQQYANFGKDKKRAVK